MIVLENDRAGMILAFRIQRTGQLGQCARQLAFYGFIAPLEVRMLLNLGSIIQVLPRIQKQLRCLPVIIITEVIIEDCICFVIHARIRSVLCARNVNLFAFGL